MTLPRTMKAIVLTGHGGLDKLAWREDVAVPQAGAGEVLITGASGGVGSAAVQLAKRRGAHVTSGAIAGPIVELDLRTLYLKDLTLIGSTRQDPAVFTDLVGYIEAGDIHPVVAQTYPLSGLRAAQEAFLEKSHMGKIGIEIPA